MLGTSFLKKITPQVAPKTPAPLDLHRAASNEVKPAAQS